MSAFDAPRRLRRLAIVAALSTQVACAAAESAPGATLLTGTVVDAATRLPVYSAVVAIEEGPSEADAGAPAYAFGAIAGSDGVFKLSLPRGQKTLHVFADGYERALVSLDLDAAETAQTIALAATPTAQAKPVLSNALFDVATATAGQTVHLSVDVSAAGAALASETVVVLPDLAWAALLDPPASSGEIAPQGTYVKAFAAPPSSGYYVYWIAATSTEGAAADALTIALPVE